MKHLATLSIVAGLAIGLAATANAQPTDNSEAGLPDHPVIGSDYWAQVYGPCEGFAPRAGYRACGSQGRGAF